MTPDTILTILGGLLVGAGILGGGFELRELKIPPLNRWTRLLAVTAGVVCLVSGLTIAQHQGGASPLQPSPSSPQPASPAPSAQAPHTFVDPTVDGIRLDWCRLWATDCGGAAAAAWCNQVGYSAAVTWEEDSNVSGRGIVTKLVGDGQLCQPPNRCDSFASITCR